MAKNLFQILVWKLTAVHFDLALIDPEREVSAMRFLRICCYYHEQWKVNRPKNPHHNGVHQNLPSGTQPPFTSSALQLQISIQKFFSAIIRYFYSTLRYWKILATCQNLTKNLKNHPFTVPKIKISKNFVFQYCQMIKIYFPAKEMITAGVTERKIFENFFIPVLPIDKNLAEKILTYEKL